MTPASPATPPATPPASSHVSLEASEIDEATDTVTEAMITIQRDDEPDEELREQILLMTPAEMQAVYRRLGTYYAHGIWTEGTVPPADAAPPASAPQEAATPVEALAAEWEAEASGARGLLTADLELEGAQVRRVLAAQLRDRLAPAWDRYGDALHRIALGQVPDGTPAAQLAYDALDGATPGPDTLAALAAENDRYRAECARYRKALEHARHVLEEHDEPDDDARSRALAIICAALEATP